MFRKDVEEYGALERKSPKQEDYNGDVDDDEIKRNNLNERK